MQLAESKSFAIGDKVELVGQDKNPEWNHRIAEIVGVLLVDILYQIEWWWGPTDRRHEVPLFVKSEHLMAVDLSKNRNNCGGCGFLYGSDKTMACQRCQCIFYCSRYCQEFHWNNGHKKICKKLCSARKAGNDESQLPTDEEDRITCRVARAQRWWQKCKREKAEKELWSLFHESTGKSKFFAFELFIIALCRQGKYDEALDCVRPVGISSADILKDKFGAVAEVYFLKGDLLVYIKEDLIGAQMAYSAALKHNPDNARTKAFLFWVGQEIRKSVHQLEKLLLFSLVNQEMWNRRGKPSAFPNSKIEENLDDDQTGTEKGVEDKVVVEGWSIFSSKFDPEACLAVIDKLELTPKELSAAAQMKPSEEFYKIVDDDGWIQRLAK